MKLHNLVWTFLIALALGQAGCANSPAYDPSIKADTSADLIQVVSLAPSPSKPIAPEPWRVTMKIKNTGTQPLENVTYQFLLGGKGEQLGQGKIAQLNPGATVSVRSEEAELEQGTYRVEGRVFLQNAKGEPEFNERINNWMATNVIVAQ